MPNQPALGTPKLSAKERQETATGLAIAALGFIANEPQQLGRFLTLTGIGPESIRSAARQPDFLVGVLDYLASDERLVLAFAAQNGLDPQQVMQAREALAGAPPDWP